MIPYPPSTTPSSCGPRARPVYVAGTSMSGKRRTSSSSFAAADDQTADGQGAGGGIRARDKPLPRTSTAGKPRRSAFDDFDELAFCDDIASRISRELAARPSRRDVARPGSIDPWRGSNGRAESNVSEQVSLLKDTSVQTGDAEVDADGHDDADGDQDLLPERTERTKAAVSAFLKRVQERQGDQAMDESEQDLEEQVFSLFGGSLNDHDGILTQQPEGHEESEDARISPQVAAQVASVLNGKREEVNQEMDERRTPLIQMISHATEDMSRENDELSTSSSDSRHSSADEIGGSRGEDRDEESAEANDERDTEADSLEQDSLEAEDYSSDADQDGQSERSAEVHHRYWNEDEDFPGPVQQGVPGANQDQAIDVSDSEDDAAHGELPEGEDGGTDEEEDDVAYPPPFGPATGLYDAASGSTRHLDFVARSDGSAVDEAEASASAEQDEPYAFDGSGAVLHGSSADLAWDHAPPPPFEPFTTTTTGSQPASLPAPDLFTPAMIEHALEEASQYADQEVGMVPTAQDLMGQAQLESWSAAPGDLDRMRVEVEDESEPADGVAPRRGKRRRT